MPKLEKSGTKKDKTWLRDEDWKIKAWDKDGNLIIKDGKPINK